MSTAATSGMAESVPTTVEPPPIAMLLPLLRTVQAGFSLLLRLGVHFLLSLLAMLYPLRIIWTIIHALLSPVFIVVKMALDIALFTPFSIVRAVAVALYPVYVFCAIACVFGAAVGMFGRYVSTAILGALARSAYFARSPSRSPATRPSSPHATLRKRKRKTVRLQ